MEIDHEYENSKWFKNKYARFLPHIISEKPEGLSIEDSEKAKEYYRQFDLKKIHEWMPTWRSNGKYNIYIYSGIWAFFWLLIPIWELIENQGSINSILLVSVIVLGSPFIYLTYKAWKRWKNAPESKYIIYDRLNSLLTMPRLNEHDSRVIPFKDLKATIRRVQVGRYAPSGRQLHFFNEAFWAWPWKPNFLTISIFDRGIYEIWSFYVWYMDKNRPLPPGTIFDEFREKDFERRKAEGFPPPLFKSLIPTPEATPEQQLVREAFWKDEDYFASEKEAKA